MSNVYERGYSRLSNLNNLAKNARQEKNDGVVRVKVN